MPFLIQVSRDHVKLYVVDEYVKTEEDDDGRDIEFYKFKLFKTVAEALPFAFETADLAKLFLAEINLPPNSVAEVIEIQVH